MMFTLLAFADETEPAAPTDEELIAQYHIPDSWARNALLFAVRNGILYGTGDGTLSPAKNATRAEIATILSRLLPTERSIDLSKYTDLKAGQWFYEPIGHAAAMGLISGDGATTMNPNGKATREQAFVMIARAFGLPKADERELYEFKDWTQVSQWAIPSIAALVKAGYVNGSNGYLNPKNNITRQEFAQVLYSLIDLIAKDLPEQADGTVLCSADGIPAGTVINGDLLLCNDAAEINLEGVTVTGKLILQGVDSVNVTITGCEIGELVLCRPATVLNDGTAQCITVNAGETTLAGTLPDVAVNADTVIEGNAQTVTVYAGTLTVAEDAQVEDLLVDYTAKEVAICVDGTVQNADIPVAVTLEGEGTVVSADVYFEPLETELMPETVNYIDDPGLMGVELTCAANKMPSSDFPWAYMDTEMTGDVPKGTGDLLWYLNGEFVTAKSNVQLKDGLHYRPQFNFTDCFSGETDPIVGVKVRYRNHERIFEFLIPIETDLMTSLSDVKTINVKAITEYRTNMYDNKELTGKVVCGIPKGTEVIYMEHFDPSTVKVKLPDGRIGYVYRTALSIPNIRYFTLKDYTTEVKETWINQQGYSSSTKYLIWVNLYTQQINIFTGSKGKWKLAFTTPCATGCRETPTPQEVTQIYYKTYEWTYETYYVHHVSVFDSRRGFHSMLYNYDGVTLHDTSMGKPASGGCIRVPDEGIMYIWNNIPVGTTVVIY